MADRPVLRAVVSQGKIQEMGSYAALSSAGGAFASLMKIQMMGAAEADSAVDAEPGALVEKPGSATVASAEAPSTQDAAKPSHGAPDAKVPPSRKRVCMQCMLYTDSQVSPPAVRAVSK